MSIAIRFVCIRWLKIELSEKMSWGRVSDNETGCPLPVARDAGKTRYVSEPVGVRPLSHREPMFTSLSQ